MPSTKDAVRLGCVPVDFVNLITFIFQIDSGSRGLPRLCAVTSRACLRVRGTGERAAYMWGSLEPVIRTRREGELGRRQRTWETDTRLELWQRYLLIIFSDHNVTVCVVPIDAFTHFTIVYLLW